VTGLDGSQEAEGKDKNSLKLPGTQLSMLQKVTAAVANSQKPVVLVVTGGSAVDLKAMKQSEGIRAIVWVGYPGQAGGSAIAKALYGENRFGKLPMTFYDNDFCNAVNLTDYRMRPDPTTGYPVRETVALVAHMYGVCFGCLPHQTCLCVVTNA
jgi:beta-D-xylosidase 4